MVPITQQFIHVNPYSRDGSQLKAKQGFVMHYTADPGASAGQIDRYFDGLALTHDRYAGAHFEVDRYSIVQAIPTNERAYHCGSTQPYLPEAIAAFGSYPNNTTCGIEMCIEADGSIHEDTFQNAADLVVWLIQNDGWPEVIFTHKGVVGWKDCPMPWVKNPSEFERFKQTVHNKLYSIPVPQNLIVEDENMKLTNAQWTQLANALAYLFQQGFLTDYTWAEKASKQTLTLSELLYLNTVMFSRADIKVRPGAV